MLRPGVERFGVGATLREYMRKEVIGRQQEARSDLRIGVPLLLGGESFSSLFPVPYLHAGNTVEPSFHVFIIFVVASIRLRPHLY